MALADLRASVATFLATAERASTRWTVPRAPGKWSPSQVVEHVARTMEESAKVAAGAPSHFPTLPFFLRPIIRLLFFRRALRKNAFPKKSKAVEPMIPTAGSATPTAARARVEATVSQFDQACRARAAAGQEVASGIFGPVSPADFARFQQLHVLHHLEQLPATA